MNKPTPMEIDGSVINRRQIPPQQPKRNLQNQNHFNNSQNQIFQNP